MFNFIDKGLTFAILELYSKTGKPDQKGSIAMKVVLAGAYGKLGSDVLRALIKEGYEVVAADIIDRDVEGLDKSSYTYHQMDATKPETMEGLCDGADAVISTVGLTKANPNLTAMDIDYQGNLNLLNEAKKAGVKKFVYVSVIKADKAPHVPLLKAKYLFEEELKKSGVDWVILRPTGYFYDIVHVFRPMIEKGKVMLLKNDHPIHCNVIDTSDFGEFIAKHIGDTNVTYDIGGKETYSYEELAKLCFEAAGKEVKISYVPGGFFDLLGKLPKNKKNGKAELMPFSKWTMSEDMVGDTVYGEHSFKEYIQEQFGGK